MGTILGTVTYVPQPKFWFNRAYIRRFAFGFNVGAAIVQTGNVFEITDTTNPIVHVHCKLRDDFWDWSSNSYTLDHVVEDWWLIIDPSPTPLPLNFILSHWWNAPDAKLGILLYLAGSTHQYPVTLPFSDPTYWFPP